MREVLGTCAPETASYCEVWIFSSEMVSGLGTALGAKAPSRVYAPALVLPLTLTPRVPRPSVPALLTSAAEPEAIDRIWVKLRVVRGTAVMVLELTVVLVDEVVTVMRHWHGTGSAVWPRSSAASSVGASPTLTATEDMRAVLNPGAANCT